MVSGAPLYRSIKSPKSPDQTLQLGRKQCWVGPTTAVPVGPSSRRRGSQMLVQPVSAPRTAPPRLRVCTAVSGNQRSDSWFGHSSVTFCHLVAHPGLSGCGAGTQGWSSSAWETSASRGCCRLHRKDGALGAIPEAHRPSPCLSRTPGLPALPSPEPQVPAAQQDLIAGAAAGTRQRRQAWLVGRQPGGCQQWPAGTGAGPWKLSGGSIAGAASPSPFSPALCSTNPHIYQD